MRLIILAAGQGTRLRPLTNERPKCLVPLSGRPLLEWQIAAAKAAGITEIIVAGGYLIDQIRAYDVSVVENPHFATTNMVQTLRCAQSHFGDGFIMSYGDIVYSQSVLQKAIESEHPISVVVDQDWRAYWQLRLDDPLSDAETLRIGQKGELLEIGQKPISYDQIEAQYIGLVKFNSDGVQTLNSIYKHILVQDHTGQNPFGGVRNLDNLYFTDLLQGMIGMGINLHALPINGQWMEVDSLSDLQLAQELVNQGRLD